MNDRMAVPAVLRDFLTYHETIQGHSKKTADEYFLDLRSFLRYLKLERGLASKAEPFDEISILDVDLPLVASVTLTDVYGYMNYLSRERGVGSAARARQISSIRSFYKYLFAKAKLIDENPVQNLDAPRLKKSLPRYLTLDESLQLLEAVDEPNRARDYCILMLFLNCGLRISELVGLDLTDVRDDRLRVLGKGNKERTVFLNQACIDALVDWLKVRENIGKTDKNALFITKNHTRITTSAVHYMIKKRLTQAGLDSSKYSAHKLRHTAATLMLQNGVDVRTLQELLGHEHLNTTQIYTHVDNNELRIAAQANPLSKVKAKK